MINVCFFFLLPFVLLKNEGFRPTEAVVQLTNRLWVTQDEASIFGRKLLSKLVKIFEISLDRNRCIKQDGQNGLSSTGVVYDLPRKEEVLVVVKQVLFLLDVFSPLEEEDKTINVRLNSCNKIVILKWVNFLYLDGRSSNLFDQLSEYSWVRLDCAPLIEHILYLNLYPHLNYHKSPMELTSDTCLMAFFSYTFIRENLSIKIIINSYLWHTTNKTGCRSSHVITLLTCLLSSSSSMKA